MDSIHRRYSANGKLLITGEYAVLAGALALALPSRYGQHLSVSSGSGQGTLVWESHELGKPWFKAGFSIPGFKIIQASDPVIAGRLKTVLQALQTLKPSLFSAGQHLHLKTDLDFCRHWGLGSSSTLIHLLSSWAGTDPYDLLQMTFGGSGYDIACAGSDKPILYQLMDGRRTMDKVSFQPPFLDSIFLVYSGLKQDSGKEVNRLSAKGAIDPSLVEDISGITRRILQCTDLKSFEELVRSHEAIISRLTGYTVAAHNYKEYPGIVKSLGAWGGDFLLFTWQDGIDTLKDYLAPYNAGPVFGLEELLYTH